MFGRQVEGYSGGSSVSGVETARDVGRGDERHQLRVQAAAFTQIAVEIDLHGTHANRAGRDRQGPSWILAIFSRNGLPVSLLPIKVIGKASSPPPCLQPASMPTLPHRTI